MSHDLRLALQCAAGAAVLVLVASLVAWGLS